MSARPFATSDDENYQRLDSNAEHAGLIFNPAATSEALVALAAARAHRLHGLVFFLSCHLKDDALEVAGLVEPLAQEIVLLLDELQRVTAAA